MHILFLIHFYNRGAGSVLNSHYEAWSYKKGSTKKLKHTGNLFRKNLQLKDTC